MNPKRDRIVGLICGVLGAAVIGIGVFWVSLPALILAAAMAALPIPSSFAEATMPLRDSRGTAGSSSDCCWPRWSSRSPPCSTSPHCGRWSSVAWVRRTTASASCSWPGAGRWRRTRRQTPDPSADENHPRRRHIPANADDRAPPTQEPRIPTVRCREAGLCAVRSGRTAQPKCFGRVSAWALRSSSRPTEKWSTTSS